MDERELNLLPYLKVLWKRKFIILGGTMICLIAATLLHFALPKTYEVSALIEIGKVWDTPSNNPYILSEMINSAPFLEEIRHKLGWNKSLKQVMSLVEARAVEIKLTRNTGEEPRRPPLLMLKTRGSSRQEAVTLAKTISDLIIERDRKRFGEALEIRKRQERVLRDKLTTIEKEVNEMKVNFNSLKDKRDTRPSEILLLQSGIQSREETSLDYMRELGNYEYKTNSPIDSYPTHLMNEITPPREPIAPSLTLNLLIALSAGVLISIVAAFALEYRRPAIKEMIRERELVLARSSVGHD